MSKQRLKLIGALTTIVGSLRDEGKLADYLEELGRRHWDHGAVPEHYELVGEVLLETMGQRSRSGWTEAAAPRTPCAARSRPGRRVLGCTFGVAIERV